MECVASVALNPQHLAFYLMLISVMARFYREAALVLKRLKQKKGSLKSLVFSTGKKSSLSYRKKLYALTVQTLKYKKVIEEVMTACNHWLKIKSGLSHHLYMIILYDMLLGKGIQCGGQIKRFLLDHKMELLAAFHKIEGKTGFLKSSRTHIHQCKEVKLPRYARVNTLKTEIIQVEEELTSCGYKLVCQSSFNLRHLASCGDSCICSTFCKDEHVPNLLRFCPGASLTSTKLYSSGHIVIQDKASCLPAFLLAPPPGSHVIDACAAPGNKSTHLACLMKNNGIIYAFDKDPLRYETLLKMIEASSASCVVSMCQDFLKTDASYFRDVKYILVDPSCSGSGISNRIEYGSQTVDAKRLQCLANFQFRILAHALSFPCVEKVVYSTCSIHEQENELVVEKALKKFMKGFKLEYALPNWKHRGHAVFPTGDHCLRADSRDQTNGFFIAVFRRLAGKKSTAMEINVDEQEHHLTKNHKKQKYKHIPVTSSR